MSEFDNYYENNSTTPDAEDVNKAAQDYEKAETAQSEPHTASQSVSQEQANSSDTQQTTPAEGSYEWNSGNGSGEYRHSYVNGNNRDSAHNPNRYDDYAPAQVQSAQPEQSANPYSSSYTAEWE